MLYGKNIHKANSKNNNIELKLLIGLSIKQATVPGVPEVSHILGLHDVAGLRVVISRTGNHITCRDAALLAALGLQSM